MFILSLAGCGADNNTAVDLGAASNAGKDAGILRLALGSDTSETRELLLNLRITKHADQSEVFTADNEFTPMMTVEVRLAPEHYDIEVKVLDKATAEIFYSGKVSDVEVVAHEITALTLKLEGNGGVDILVDIDNGGDNFIEDTTTATTPANTRGSVTRRRTTHGVEYWYYQAARKYHDYGPEYGQLWKASTAVGLMQQTQPVYTHVGKFNQGTYYKPEIASIGEDLFLSDISPDKTEVSIYRFNFDTEKFEPFSKIPIERRLPAEGSVVAGYALDSQYPLVTNCVLSQGSGFHILCGVSFVCEKYGRLAGLVEASSKDGINWTPLLPYESPESTVPTLVSKPVFLTQYGDKLRARMITHGGIRTIYLMFKSYVGKLQIFKIRSLDGKTWSTLNLESPVFSMPDTVHEIYGIVPSVSTQDDPGNWHLFYQSRITTSQSLLKHATSD